MVTTLLFALFALNRTTVPETSTYTQTTTPQSHAAPSNPMWAKHGMTMDAVDEWETGFLFDYDQNHLRFQTTYAGLPTETVYSFNVNGLVRATYHVHVGGGLPQFRYDKYAKLMEHTRSLVGEREHSMGVKPWRWTFADNIDIHGLEYALSHANHWAEWVLEEGVLAIVTRQVGFYMAIEINWIPRKL